MNYLKNLFVAIQIILVADIVENLFIEKDLETINLQERLRYVESNLGILTCDNDRNINNLEMQLNEKCKIIEEVMQQMSNLQKVCANCLHVHSYFCVIRFSCNCTCIDC